MTQIRPDILEAWIQTLIRKSADRLVELDGVDITSDEAEAFVRVVITEYERLVNDIDV